MSRISRCFACQQYNCVCPTRDEAIEQLHNIGKGAHELLELLRDKWACPDTDAMTLYLASFLAGVAEQWLKNPPPNGFTHVSTFPGIGDLQIDIRKLDGQSPAEALRDRDARIAELTDKLQTESHRLEDEIRENLQQRERIAALEAERDAAVERLTAVVSAQWPWIEYSNPSREEWTTEEAFRDARAKWEAARNALYAPSAAARAGKAGE